VDEEMVVKADALARDRGVSDRVIHHCADVSDLPFEDESFEAVRAERLFQNIPVSQDTNAFLAELLRVLKPRGRLVLVDSDFSSASVDFDDAGLERQMMQFCAMHMRPNGLIARHFYQMLKDQGLKNVQVRAFPLIFTTLAESPFGKVLVDAAVGQGFIDGKTGTHWTETLEALEREGKFFACLNVLVVSGSKS
jgi:ubiquinone/menaquinone biosynthesis C-methylase UbiE